MTSNIKKIRLWYVVFEMNNNEWGFHVSARTKNSAYKKALREALESYKPILREISIEDENDL